MDCFKHAIKNLHFSLDIELPESRTSGKTLHGVFIILLSQAEQYYNQLSRKQLIVFKE